MQCECPKLVEWIHIQCPCYIYTVCSMGVKKLDEKDKNSKDLQEMITTNTPIPAVASHIFTFGSVKKDSEGRATCVLTLFEGSSERSKNALQVSFSHTTIQNLLDWCVHRGELFFCARARAHDRIV